MNAKEFLIQVIHELSGEVPTVDIVEGQGIIFQVGVRGKVARVVGKDGRTIASIRTIAKAIGYNDNHNIGVMLNEPSSRPD